MSARGVFFVAVFATSAAAAPSSCTSLPNGTNPAAAADAFVDSVGINVHLSYFRTPYVDNFPFIAAQLSHLGVRHIRDGLIDTKWQGYYDHLRALAGQGIKADLVTDVGQSASLLTSYPARVPQAIESYEAPNEYDTRRIPDWAAKLAAFQKVLYTTIKGNASTAAFPILGPSLTSYPAYQAVGDLSSYMDFGNLHNYFGGHNPGTGGWGDNGYGSIVWNLNAGKILASTKPIITTETGYYTSAGVQGIPEIQAGRYVPRLFLEQFKSGIARTYLYEFIDEGHDTANSEDHYGLLRYDGSAKPAYTALANLLQLLQDPGKPVAVGGLTYSLSGSTANVHQALIQKRDGTLYLFLWLEVPSYDVNTHATLPVSAQAVTVHISQVAGTPLLYTLDDTGAMSHFTAPFSHGMLTLAVTDRISVIVLPPQRSSCEER